MCVLQWAQAPCNHRRCHQQPRRATQQETADSKDCLYAIAVLKVIKNPNSIKFDQNPKICCSAKASFITTRCFGNQVPLTNDAKLHGRDDVIPVPHRHMQNWSVLMPCTLSAGLHLNTSREVHYATYS